MSAASICLVLDDRAHHLTPITGKIKACGLRVDIAEKARALRRKLNELANPGSGLKAILLDNHIDDCLDLRDWQREDVSTDNGTTAGYRIAKEILIPKINKGELPRLPIGIMSAHDVTRVRDEFEATGDDRYDSLFFFTKEELTEQSGESALFFTSMADAALTAAEKDSAYLAVAEGFREKFGLSDREMSAIFALTENPSYTERLGKGTLSADSVAWHDMAAALLKIQGLLLRLHEGAPDQIALAKSRLRNSRLLLSAQTPLQALKTGKLEQAMIIIAELSMADTPAHGS